MQRVQLMDAMNKQKNALWNLVNEKMGPPKHMAEVATCDVKRCFATEFVQRDPDVRLTLVEPIPKASEQVIQWMSDRNVNAHTWHCLVGDRIESDVLMRYSGDRHWYWGGAYVSGTHSPESFEDDKNGYTDFLTVSQVTFDMIDDGTIDFLLLDVEGQEWFVLKHMKSRPKMIKVEVRNTDSGFVNEHIDKIEQWATDNGYTKEVQGGDWILLLDL